MPIKLKNVSHVADGQAGIGQTHYFVDSAFRTAAQGWTRADRTGPLDLFIERNPGYVFRTADYASTAVALQAANDAMIAYRGDVLFFSPCNLTVAAVVTANRQGARWLGRPIRGGRSNLNRITTTIANGLTFEADELELGYFKFLPTTAQVTMLFDTAMVGAYVHDIGWDSTGVAASTSTIGMNFTGACTDWLMEGLYWVTDAAQGPLMQIAAAIANFQVQYFYHFHNAGTLAIGLANFIAGSAGVRGIRFGPGIGQIAGAGIVTNLISSIDLTGTATKVTIDRFYGSVGYATATTLAAHTGNDMDRVNNYIATVPAGAGGALYTT